ncbi:MAG: hypothetical protein ACRDTT_34655 [Pseudonocardiaceae bacterium]
MSGLPYPAAQATLEEMFGEPVAQLLGALAVLNRLDEVHAAVARATEARECVQPDELDILGGICNFSRPPQLHYAAEALSWGGAPEASHAEQFALEALNAYAVAPQAAPSETKQTPAAPSPSPEWPEARSTAQPKHSSR